MSADHRAGLIDSTFAETIGLHERMRRALPEAIGRAADALIAALRAGGTVLVCGNGGSAADAQHFAAELVARFEREREAWPVIALSTDTSVLTAIANDYAYDRVFARQVEAHGRRGGVLLGISTSGGSRNVLAAMSTASERGLTTIALTGRDGGAVGREADIHINVAALSTARVQEVHIMVLHILCDLVERELTESSSVVR
jgi:D-sedoheptulose 7-phosphate isomerase